MGKVDREHRSRWRVSRRGHGMWRLVVLAGFTMAISSCQPKSQRDEAADIRDSWPSPAPAGVDHPASLAVAQGPAPLFYRGQQAGTIHITDATTNAELASAEVGPGSIVWVNEDKGVFADSRQLRPGPLPGGHTYSMRLEIDSGNTWRTGVQAPAPAGKSARPADSR